MPKAHLDASGKSRGSEPTTGIDASGVGTSTDGPRRSSWATSNEPLRRAMNILVALVGIALFAPPMLAIAFLAKLDSWGPATHRQQRAGVDRSLSREPAFESPRRGHERGFRIS